MGEGGTQNSAPMYPRCAKSHTFGTGASDALRGLRALYVCLICMPYVYALYVRLICSLICMPCMPYMYVLYVCLICMSYMHALYIICMSYRHA